MRVYTRAETSTNAEDRFAQMLPAIMRDARVVFRGMGREARDDAITEVVAHCWVSFCDLLDRQDDAPVFPSALARYAIKRVRDNRHVGSKTSAVDILSKHCQRVKDVCQANLGQDAGQVADKTADPAHCAAMRLDFDAWIASLPEAQRKLALVLATGESSSAVAKMLRVTAGRVSQMRRALERSWRNFTGETSCKSTKANAISRTDVVSVDAA
jgi:hypothetical protein